MTQSISWDDMYTQRTEPPYIPDISKKKDISNYQYYQLRKQNQHNDRLQDDPHHKIYGWCDNF